MAQLSLQQVAEVHSARAARWLAYLDEVARRMAQNPLLARLGRDLDQMRVPLQVTPYAPQRQLDDAHQRQDARRDTGPDDDDPRRAYARGAAPQRREKLDELAPQLSLALLLGDPGAGKTEWLKQLVAQASRREAKRVRGFAVSNLDAVRLPVFVRLDSVGAHLPTPKQARKFLRQHGCITAQGYKPDNAELFAVGVIQALLAEKLMDARLAGEVWARLRPLVPGAAVPPPAQTRALLALDAWDEARKARDTLNAPLREYLERSPAQVFITSRLVDFEGEAFHVTTNDEAGPRRKLRVLPFTLTETEQFARDFFARDADGPRLAREFGDELRRKPTVAATAENPLLATLLCQCFVTDPEYRRARLALPARRVEVYERIAAGLLGDWHRAKRKATKTPTPPAGLIELSEWEADALLELLEDLALETFPDEILDGKKLKVFLRNYLKGLEVGDPLRLLMQRVAQQGIEFLAYLCDTGLLTRIGDPDAPNYLFLHLTFQEYLVSGALARRLQPAPVDAWLPPAPEPQNRAEVLALHPLWRKIDLDTWHPQWREVLLMLAGRLKKPLSLLHLLTDEATDDYYRHRLGLAAECLAELPGPGHRVAPLTAKIDEITDTTFWSWADHDAKRMGGATHHLTRALPSLVQARGCLRSDQHRTREIPLLALLTEQLAVKQINTDLFRALGGLAATPEILAQLATLLQNANWKVRNSAQQAMSAMGSAAATPEFLSQLATLLQNAHERVPRRAAFFVVSMLGSAAATPEILAQLATLLHDADGDVQRSAARAVDDLAAIPEIPPLFHDRDGDVQISVAQAVGKFLACVQDDSVLLLREHISYELGKMQDKGWRFFLAYAKDGSPLATALRVKELCQGQRPVWDKTRDGE